MGDRILPPHIAHLVHKPGRAWSEPERTAFDEWLLVPEQLARDTAVAGAILYQKARRAATPEDVDDAVSEFHCSAREAVIRGFSPEKGPFWAYYKESLRNVARKRAAKLRALHGREIPLVERTADGERPADDTIADTNATSAEDAAADNERSRRLHDCIERALNRFERDLVRARLRDVPFEELAATLGKSSVALRVRHMRAIDKLRACMTAQAARVPSPVPPLPDRYDVEVDALVIGGGVMGLCMLGGLRAGGYSAILLEQDRLGGGQTCHSHLYIHGGFVHRTVALASRLKEAEAVWRTWLAQHPEVERAFGPPIFGFRAKSAANRRRDLWDHPDLRLDYTEVNPLPDVLSGGQTRIAYASPEICLRGHSLVEALRAPVNDYIGRATAVTFRVKRSPDRIDRVAADLPNGERITIRPRAVVCAAGAGNQALIDEIRAAAGVAGVSAAVQQVRQSYMMAIKGHREVLPPLTGVFQVSHTLFIVARVSGDEVVWLVSDEQGPPVPRARYDDRAGLERWRPGTCLALEELAPRVFASPAAAELQWLGYSAPKAEGFTASGTLPDGPRVDQCGFRNLWVVWPSKLTLAPLLTMQLVPELGAFIGVRNPWRSIPATWSATRCRPASAMERWQEALPEIWERTGVCA